MTEIYKEILSNIDDKYDKSEGGFVSDLVQAVSLQFSDQDKNITNILDSLDVEKLEGKELERFVFQRSGVVRKPSTYATAMVEFTGQIGAQIPKGTLVASDDVFYTVDEDIIIGQNGSAFGQVTCEDSGIVGNVPVGAINSFPITVERITLVRNISSVTNGYEEESDKDLRARYYEKLQKPGKAGNEYHYLEWSKSVIGVGKVKVFPRWDGPLTVRLSILDSNTNQASEDLIDSVSKYIDTQKPFGAEVTVTTGNIVLVDISVDLVLERSSNLDDVLAILREKIQEHFKKLTYESSYISYAQIGKEILNVEGVVDYNNLLINGTTSSISLNDEDIPMVGEVS